MNPPEAISHIRECFSQITVGTIIHFEFKVKMIDESGSDPSCDIANSSGDTCPFIRIKIQTIDGSKSWTNEYIRGGYSESWNAGGWNTFSADWTVPSTTDFDDMIDFQPLFYGGQYGENTYMIVDEIEVGF